MESSAEALAEAINDILSGTESRLNSDDRADRQLLLEEMISGVRARIRELLPATVTVELYKPSGRYYTEEEWRIPDGAIEPYDMLRSPDFRRIDGGIVVIPAQAPFDFPHVFPAVKR